LERKALGKRQLLAQLPKKALGKETKKNFNKKRKKENFSQEA